MKKIIGVIACGLFLNAAAASSQVTDKEKVQMEKRIEKLIKKMTLEEKVGQMAQYSCNWDVTGPVMTGDYETLLKQGLVGSLFNVYTVDGVRKMQEMALSESRLKIPVRLSPPLGIRSWLTVGARCWARRLAGVRRMCCWARV